jgi:uncharacterized protein YndB with AHSA1/START domain
VPSPLLVNLEVTSSRTFPVSRTKVFAAFENPDALVQWWGPDGFTNRVVAFDLTAGGTWRVIMTADNDAEFDNISRFIEVVKPERIVYDHLQPIHHFRMTMTFAELAPDRTKLTWHMEFDRPASHEKLGEFIAGANEQNFDRLAAYLARKPIAL